MIFFTNQKKKNNEKANLFISISINIWKEVKELCHISVPFTSTYTLMQRTSVPESPSKDVS